MLRRANLTCGFDMLALRMVASDGVHISSIQIESMIIIYICILLCKVNPIASRQFILIS